MTDTIAAVASGAGAVGVLRISGTNALIIAARIFPTPLTMPRHLYYGAFCGADGGILDQGLAAWFAAPASYTGEDVVEFFCHGSPVVLAAILDACFAAGARAAKPGEFTRRAFLNGKLDLTQAEAVVDLVEAETVSAAKSAAAQLTGRIGREIQTARGTLLDLAAEFCAFVDYPDDDIKDFDTSSALATLGSVHNALAALADSYARGKILKDGVKTALLGRPNAGKSSLLNALVGYERSIVTATAGTTRDTVEESVFLGGVRLKLIDTAGLRETQDSIEREGVLRAEKAANAAELLLCVFDGAQSLNAEDQLVLDLARERRAIAIINKSDLPCVLTPALLAPVFDDRIVVVSAQEAHGLDALSALISSILETATLPCDGGLITNARHAACVRGATERVQAAHEALARGLTPDVAVCEVEAAIALLGEVTGETASDAVVSRIFERFCVGK